MSNNRKTFNVKCSLSIGLISDRHEILVLEEVTEYTVEALNAMSQDELEQVIYDACKEWAWEYIDFGGELINV